MDMCFLFPKINVQNRLGESRVLNVAYVPSLLVESKLELEELVIQKQKCTLDMHFPTLKWTDQTKSSITTNLCEILLLLKNGAEFYLPRPKQFHFCGLKNSSTNIFFSPDSVFSFEKSWSI